MNNNFTTYITPTNSLHQLFVCSIYLYIYIYIYIYVCDSYESTITVFDWKKNPSEQHSADGNLNRVYLIKKSISFSPCSKFL
jgi:hypothetical protein